MSVHARGAGARRLCWVRLSAAKSDIGANRIGGRANRARGLICRFICVDAYIRKIIAQARLHISAYASVQRLAGRAHSLLYLRCGIGSISLAMRSECVRRYNTCLCADTGRRETGGRRASSWRLIVSVQIESRSIDSRGPGLIRSAGPSTRGVDDSNSRIPNLPEPFPAHQVRRCRGRSAGQALYKERLRARSWRPRALWRC